MASKKTTVSFPENVLKAMRTYMVREGMNLHDQSNVVIYALTEYLEKRNVVIEGDPKKAILFEVEEIKSES